MDKTLNEYYEENNNLITNELELINDIEAELQLLKTEAAYYKKALKSIMFDNEVNLEIKRKQNTIPNWNPFKDTYGLKEKAHLRRCIETSEVRLRRIRQKLDQGRVTAK